MTDLTNLSSGSTVAGCCVTGSCGHADGAGEIVRLRRWKAHAVELILRWDRLADDVPCPLGGIRSDAVADEIERLRAAIDALVAEVDDDHQPEWASEQAKANGKEPWCCQWCGPQDGAWPCIHRRALDDLKEARK